MPTPTLSKVNITSLRYPPTPTLYAVAYSGTWIEAEVINGSVQIGRSCLTAPSTVPDGTRLVILVTKPRDPIPSKAIVYDIAQLGTLADLTSMTFSARYALLDLLFPHNYDVESLIFGTRPLSESLYIAEYTAALNKVAKCEDSRYAGVIARDPELTTFDMNVCNSVRADEDEDLSAPVYTPIENESEKVMKYQNMVWMMIRKMSGKWRDVSKKHHCPGQLPYDSDDLMQKGLMEVMIALRKFDSKHISHAKDSTFAYHHLWNRMGQIAVKYSKHSRGYGVWLDRDVPDDAGNIISSADYARSADRHTTPRGNKWMQSCSYINEDEEISKPAALRKNKTRPLNQKRECSEGYEQFIQDIIKSIEEE